MTTISLTMPFVSRKVRVKWSIFWTFSCLLGISLLMFCVFQLNAYTSERFALEKYQKSLNILAKENTSLEMGLFNENTLNNIESQVLALNFEKVEATSYIILVDNQVVLK